jgi:hypothetical protein
VSYTLRFVQKFRPQDRAEFMKWESMFAAMEQRRDDLPKGRRSQPMAGPLPTNSLIWECDFTTLADAEQAILALSNDGEHEVLYRQQAAYMTEAYTEITEILDFGMSGEGKP